MVKGGGAVGLQSATYQDLLPKTATVMAVFSGDVQETMPGLVWTRLVACAFL
jgi:hypothetical protein